MQNWKYESIEEHQDYSNELERLHELKLDLARLKQDTLPKKEKEHEILKHRSMETEKVSWSEAEESKKELEQLRYKAKYLKAKILEQQEKVEELKESARSEVNRDARANMLKALEKSLEAYDMMLEAHNEYNMIRSKQLHALKLSSGERNDIRKAPKLPLHIPHPFRNQLNDIWYKQAKEYLQKNA